MNNRERSLAILRYQNYDRMPVVHFGYWTKTITKWVEEGHIEKVVRPPILVPVQMLVNRL